MGNVEKRVTRWYRKVNDDTLGGGRPGIDDIELRVDDLSHGHVASGRIHERNL
jgi:hypothetical protein